MWTSDNCRNPSVVWNSKQADLEVQEVVLYRRSFLIILDVAVWMFNHFLLVQAWQPKPGGLLATGGQDGCVFVYSLQDYVEAVPLLCIPVASAEHAEEPVTQIIWGSDNQLYTGHSSGTSTSLYSRVSLLKCTLGLIICTRHQVYREKG